MYKCLFRKEEMNSMNKTTNEINKNNDKIVKAKVTSCICKFWTSFPC